LKRKFEEKKFEEEACLPAGRLEEEV